MKAKLTPFHLAIPVRDLESSRKFYGELLQCEEGRSTEHWIDYDFFGHQLVVHMKSGATALIPPQDDPTNAAVDGDAVPIPHFGVVLELSDWETLANTLTRVGVEFVIAPKIRFRGQPGEQATLFLLDPSGNALEFKAFGDIETQLFAK